MTETNLYEVFRKWFDDNYVFPTIRIHKIILSNFKSVEYGDVDFDCSSHFVPYGTKSDILGVYGQNGSGKTALIDAIALLGQALRGLKVNSEFADCISIGKDKSTLSFLFDFQYPGGDIRKVEYTFSIRAEENASPASQSFSKIPDEDDDEEKTKVVIFDEILKIGGSFGGDKKSLVTVFDTSAKYSLFGPVIKQSCFFDDLADKEIALRVKKERCADSSTSFIFSMDTINMMRNDSDAKYVMMIHELSYFAYNFLYVISTKTTGFIRMNFMVPFHTSTLGFVPIPLDGHKMLTVPEEAINEIERTVEAVNFVLSQLVPDLSVKIVKRNKTSLKDGTPAFFIELVSEHTDPVSGIVTEMPFRYESDGVRKIFSVLHLIITAYNQQSTTVAIDEFDAGVFEYLLGEILSIFQESGKGQLIFTSHNLRPLEVLDRRFIIFTTTNPKNRYYRLKGISTTSNLRSVYFREILMNEQDETLYNATKEFKIVSAFRRANQYLQYEEET